MAYGSGKRRYELPEGKTLRFRHTEFALEINSRTKAKCNEDGKITLTQDQADGTYDEVVVPASAIFKIADMLTLTRKKPEVVDRGDVPPRED